MKVFVVPLTALLMGCSISASDRATDKEAADSALCDGLSEPMDTLADTLLEYQKKTPAPVIISGTRVIKGYDSGCKD
jgi:hypothetical protein